MKSDARVATEDLIKNIKNVFQDYTKSARSKSWEAVTSGQGKSVVNKIINDPKTPVYGIAKLLNFKEWLSKNP